MLLPLVSLLLCAFASASYEVHQEYLASEPVSLCFEIGGTKKCEDCNTTTIAQLARVLHLFPDIVKTNLLLVAPTKTVFKFNIQLLNSSTHEKIGDKIHRTIQISPSQPWFNDTFTTDSGVSLSIATRIKCAPNFFGPRCSGYCDEKVAQSGRKRCDAMGRIRCDVGWMGPHCSQVVDPRKCNCHNHGICVSSRIHNITDGPEERLMCECVNGYTGEKCEVPAFTQFEFTAPSTDSCSSKDACLNGAQCFPNGPAVFCACPLGFVGEFCEISFSTQVPTVEITAKTSGYSYTVYSMTGIFFVVVFLIGFCTYTLRPRRENALTRGQEPSPYATPETKSMLIDPEAVDAKKVFTVEDSVKKVDEEVRYTVAPQKTISNEYATIQKASSTPPPPNVPQPPIPYYTLPAISHYV